MKYQRSINSLLVFLLLGLTFNLHAQQSGRQFNSIKVLGDNIEIQVSDGKYLIEPLNDYIVHTIFYPSGKDLKNFSFAADMKAEKVDFTLTDEGNNIVVKSNGISLKITKVPFKISYYFQNKLLISENKGYVGSDTTKLLNFSIEKEEVLYGGGARVLGMDRRGNRLQLYNRAHYGYETHSELMNYTLPLFLSSKQYAVLFDNASAGFLDLDSKMTSEVTYETSSGTPNYHVIAGNNWFHLIEQYTRLTGSQPLPPRWAFGNFSSRFGYHSQAETEATVNKFFKDGIPLEAVIIDIYWFGKDIKGTMGNLDWYTDSFPSPEKMIKRFQKKGVKTILVTEPFILTTSNRWQEAVDNKILATDGKGNPYTYDFYFGNTGLIDIYDPVARDWFWNIYKKFTNQGIGGWWGDLGEPEVHPSALQHINGSADELHNSYGHEWAKLIYEGYQKDFPDIRPFILMRAGYAGSQRYGMIPWTGDVSRSWGGLVPQPEISLQMGMQGLAYMHSDLGGFAGGDSLNNELYTRWLQYGVFQPVYRPHAQEQIPAEPVFQNATTKARAKKAIELRYRLMPYIYNMAFDNSRTGKPLMIPLFFVENQNPELLTYDKAYMWGDAFLVSPVKAPGLSEQSIYLPKGSTWTDFNTGMVYPGGTEITVPLNIEYIPVFVKGGSFIPMTLKAASTASYSLDAFELHYYADTLVRNSKFRLYNDDGETPDAYAKGRFEKMEFIASEEQNTLNITLTKIKASDRYKKITNQITLKVHNLDQKPAGIKISGSYANQHEWQWDPNQNLLTIKTKCLTEPTEIEIFKKLY
jgi:alpha-glucosidase (family GH31 glycosyl hydrolase)